MITRYMLITMTRLRPALVEKWQVGSVKIPTFHTRISGLFEQQMGSIEGDSLSLIAHRRQQI